MIKYENLKNRSQWSRFGESLQALEKIARYPYGDDFFQIDHGQDYFRFFDRLGEPRFAVALSDSKVVGCAAGIIRRVPVSKTKWVDSWYLCDLKIHPDFRKQRIPGGMFRKCLISGAIRCFRSYAISMNPASGQNRVVKILEKFSLIPFRYAGLVNFYGMNLDTLIKHRNEIEKCVGPVRALSLSGIKDLILQSTGQPMPLFHMQHGPLAAGGESEPTRDGVYMFCAHESTPLDKLLNRFMPATTSGSLITFRMNPTSWDFLLTSDI